MQSPTKTSLVIRRADERFHSSHGWLDSYHTFSFARHYDPEHVGYESLRVINDDTVAPKMGFGEHDHDNMEIISYVISGQLAHQDSMGNGRTISAGEFQYMSAGSGVSHSEVNPSTDEPVHFLQIWLQPKVRNTEPRYAEMATSSEGAGLVLVASPNGAEGSMPIHSDASLYLGSVEAGEKLVPSTKGVRHWIHVISGSLEIEGRVLNTGDGAAIEGPVPTIIGQSRGQFLLFAFPEVAPA